MLEKSQLFMFYNRHSQHNFKSRYRLNQYDYHKKISRSTSTTLLLPNAYKPSNDILYENDFFDSLLDYLRCNPPNGNMDFTHSDPEHRT